MPSLTFILNLASEGVIRLTTLQTLINLSVQYGSATSLNCIDSKYWIGATQIASRLDEPNRSSS
jgi:hypothetical protein